MAHHLAVTYRLLGHERVALTRHQVETMLRDGLLNLDTKGICDGEGFATAISARPEFRRLTAEARKVAR
jgi:hypothetical protein